jgi:hypothetical protein
MNEQFWVEVIEAHSMVSFNHERIVKVARNGKHATVMYFENDLDNGIIITVREVETETKDPLPVPPTGSGRGRR